MFIYKGNSNFYQRVFAVLLAIAFFLPSVVQQIHEIEHKHEVVNCDHDHNDTHLHEYVNECDFCKFKLNNKVLVFTNPLTLIKRDFISLELSSNTYNYLHNYQKLSYLLRAPPSYI